MCGINLILDRMGFLDQNPIRKMNAALRHRGPDHNEALELRTGESKIYLGNTRLRVIDRKTPVEQPIYDQEERYFLSYNGELYNYHDLKNLLINKHYEFRTQGDTEVVLNMLIEFGDRALEMFDGMFALVFVDREEGKIIAARDRFGIKPLYFYQNDYFLVVSSEIRGVLASGIPGKELNSEQVVHYLSHRFADAPETFFRNIYSVMPGESLEYSKQGLVKKSYVSAGVVSNWNQDNLVKDVSELLLNSISNQLYADLTPALFLSGGVDSTLILALSSRELGRPLEAYTLINEKDLSRRRGDALYAEKAIRQFGGVSRDVVLSYDDTTLLPAYFDTLDQPIGDSGGFATWLLSRFSKKDHTVVLSGAGADEYFGGYRRHSAYAWYLKNYKLLFNGPNRLRFFNQVGKVLPGKRFSAIRKFLNSVDQDPQRTYEKFMGNSQVTALKERRQIDPLDHALQTDRRHYLINDVLAISDTVTMSNSQEMRVPYLSNALVDRIETIPAEVLLKNGSKWVLKDILKKCGGSDFATRPKSGFGTGPEFLYHLILDKQLSYLFEDKNSTIFSFVEEGYWRQICNQFLKGHHEYFLEVWSIITLAYWLDKEFKV